MRTHYTLIFLVGICSSILSQNPKITISDSNGTNNPGDFSVSENSTIQTGSFSLVANDGFSSTSPVLSIADENVGSTDITLTQLNNLSSTPIVITGGNDGSLTLTDFNIGTGIVLFEFDPTGINRDHSAGDNSVIETYQITLTDALGASVSDSLDILITDTAPTAAADRVTFNEDETAYAFGDVINGGSFCGGFGTDITCFLGADTSGSDTAIEVIDYSFNGNSVMGNTVNNDLIIDNIISRRNFSIDGTFGIRILSEMDQIQELDNGDVIERIIQYTITDTDGDTSTSTLTITIEGVDEPANVQAIRDAAGTSNSVSVAQLNAIDGVSGAVVERESFYQAAIENATGEDIDIASEIQALVDTVNALDIVNPRLASVIRQDPMVETTDADSVTLRYVFDEPVMGVTTSNFTTTNPLTTINVTPVPTPVSTFDSTPIYDVTYSGNSIANFNGVVTFPFDASGITDTSNNPIITNTVVGTNENTYEFVNILISIAAPSQTIANASSTVSYSVLFFFQDNISLTTNDIILNTTGDATADIAVSNGIIANQRNITFSNISGNGTIGFSIAEGAATSNAGFQSEASVDSVTFAVDTAKPTVVLSSNESNPTTNNPITVNVTFSEPISDFIESSFEVMNGTVSNINGFDSNFTISVTPTDFGLVEVTFKENETLDVADNFNEASNTFSIIYEDFTLKTNEFSTEELGLVNPVSDIILMPESVQIDYISIYDIRGQVISNSLNTENLSSGVYILEIIDQKGRRFTSKVIKE